MTKLHEACPDCRSYDGVGVFHHSVVSSQNKEPYVHFLIVDHEGERLALQCDPDEARQIGRVFFETAEAAETDAGVLDFLRRDRPEGAGLPLEAAGRFLQLMRARRRARGTGE